MSGITFSEIMEYYPGHNKSVYEDLKKDCQRGCLIPFVGAGLSVFCGYLQWPEVLRQLAGFVYDGKTREMIKINIESNKLLTAAQEIYDNYPRMFKELQKLIDYEKIQNCEKDILYASAVYVLPYLFQNGLVMTTNFDRVLEEIYGGCHKKFGNVVTPYETDLLSQIRQSDPHCLFKLHGDIGPEIRDIKRLVFTQKQYDEAYADGGPLMEELPTWFQNKRLLFLGCSLAMDKTMEVLQKVTEKNPGLDHYAILSCSPEEIGTRCKEMGKMGISPICYPPKRHEAVRVILERLLEEMDDPAYEELKRYTEKCIPVSKAEHRFMYDAEYIEFTGRERELAQLQAFCDAPAIVSWWAVIGPGGMGKSRLVYEFTKARRADGWKICWMRYEDYNNLSHWALPTDRCIVVADDVQSYLQAIGQWLMSIADRRRSEKLRILLLEREGADMSSAKWAEMMQADSPYDNTISSMCYQDDFLSLWPLSGEELKSIMTNFAAVSGRAFPNGGYADRLLQTLQKIDSGLQRPIYALAIVDAWCSGNNPSRWDKLRVLDQLVKRELKFYYERLHNLSSKKISKEMCTEIENLLARSCIMPFFPLEQIDDKEYPKLCRRADELDLDLYELLRLMGIVHKITLCFMKENGEEAGEELRREKRIEAVILDCPDLVKEYLVLQQAFDKRQLSLILPEGWEEYPVQINFLERVLFDYPEKLEGRTSFWERVFDGKPQSAIAIRFYAQLLYTVIRLIPKLEVPAMARLEELHTQFREDENIALFYATALADLTVNHPLGECGQRVSNLKQLYDRFPGKEEFAVAYAGGLCNLTAGQSLKECEQTVNTVKQLYGQFPCNEKLADAYAKALHNLAGMQSSEKAGQSVEELKQLYERFSGNKELAISYIGGLLLLTVEQSLEMCEESVKKMRQLYERFPENEEIVTAYAGGLCNLTAEQSLEQCEKNVEEVRRLYEQFPDQSELEDVYAKGLCFMAEKQALEACKQSVDKIKQLYLHNRKNAEFAITYMYGLYHLAAKRSPEECSESMERLRQLYEQFSSDGCVAAAYALCLSGLTAEQTLAEREISVVRLKRLYDRFPGDEAIAVNYIRGLYNLAIDQPAEACEKTVDKLAQLYRQFQSNTKVAVGYAEGIANLIANHSLEKCEELIEKACDLYRKNQTNEELAAAYALGLLNYSYIQSTESDVWETVKKAETLMARFPANINIQVLCAKTWFNLTLVQDPDALRRTVENIRLFLLEHPKANKEFQGALEEYLGKHPDHTGRYEPLRI